MIITGIRGVTFTNGEFVHLDDAAPDRFNVGEARIFEIVKDGDWFSFEITHDSQKNNVSKVRVNERAVESYIAQ